MKRKYFIGLAGLGVAAVAIPSWYYFSRPANEPSLFFPETLSYIWDKTTMTTIGQKYIERYPEENSPAQLMEYLSVNLPFNRDSFMTALASRTKEDYQQNRTETIEGWILSKTEARQCALYALTANQ